MLIDAALKRQVFFMQLNELNASSSHLPLISCKNLKVWNDIQSHLLIRVNASLHLLAVLLLVFSSLFVPFVKCAIVHFVEQVVRENEALGLVINVVIQLPVQLGDPGAEAVTELIVERAPELNKGRFECEH